MAAVRLLGVGILFAVAFPQHGGGVMSRAEMRSGALPAAGAASLPPSLRPESTARGGVLLAAESPRLRALRTNESDLFKNLPDAPRACEGSDCRPDPRDSSGESADDATAFFANLRMPEIPIRPHERVKQYVEYFTQNSEGRRVFRTWLKRSGRYSKTVNAAIRELLLPQDLQAVVFVESGYSPKAVSSAGAVGLWQFMADTGRVYGLAVETDLDERRSVERSSHAAVKLLADMRDRFGSWELALAAYNMGYKALIDRIKDVSTNDFWTLSEIDGVLPRETVLYVPKVLATAVILRNLDRFGLDDTHVDAPVVAADLDVPSGTRLALVARASGSSVKTLRELNPELLTDVVPDRGRTYPVHVPSGGMARAQSLLPRLLEQRDRGDGLERVASDDFDWGRDDLPKKHYRYDPYASDDGDRDRSRDRDRGDREPEEPRRLARVAPRRAAIASDADDDRASAGSAGRNVILYRVGESESVGHIARTFGTTTGQIIDDNYLDPDGKLQKGMLLIVEVSPKSMSRIMKKRASTRLDIAPSEGAAGREERAEDDDAAPSKPQPRTMRSVAPAADDDDRSPAARSLPSRRARTFFSDDMKTGGWRG
jgi:membrane-bound lytic murein transglycosylase D